jgi:hypothetical protein
MTHDEQVARANEHFADFKRIYDILAKDRPMTEQDIITLECFGLEGLTKEVIAIERLLHDAFGYEWSFALAEVLLRAIYMESLPAEEREAIWRARDEIDREWNKRLP